MPEDFKKLTMILSLMAELENLGTENSPENDDELTFDEYRREDGTINLERVKEWRHNRREYVTLPEFVGGSKILGEWIRREFREKDAAKLIEDLNAVDEAVLTAMAWSVKMTPEEVQDFAQAYKDFIDEIVYMIQKVNSIIAKLGIFGHKD